MSLSPRVSTHRVSAQSLVTQRRQLQVGGIRGTNHIFLSPVVRKLYGNYVLILLLFLTFTVITWSENFPGIGSNLSPLSLGGFLKSFLFHGLIFCLKKPKVLFCRTGGKSNLFLTSNLKPLQFPYFLPKETVLLSSSEAANNKVK